MCFFFYWQYLLYMDHSKGNNHSSRIKGKHNGKWTVRTSVYISVKCFAVFESSTSTFVGFTTKQITLLSATSMILRFAVSRAMLKFESLQVVSSASVWRNASEIPANIYRSIRYNISEDHNFLLQDYVERRGEERRGVYRVFVRKPEGKKPLGRPGRRWRIILR